MRLHDQVKLLKLENETLKEGIKNLRLYLSSEKFWDCNLVNVNDIFLRLDEVQKEYRKYFY